jgi:hypothetical protein
MCDLLNLVDEQSGLDELDIPVRRIPVNVCVRNYKTSARFFVLHETNDGNVVLAQHAIEHVVCLLEVLSLHRNGTEFNELLLHQLVSVQTPVNSILQSRKSTYLDAL